MLKGINQWCFPKTWSLKQMFAEAARAGFCGIELNLSLGEARKGSVPSLVSDLQLDEMPGLTLQSTAADARQIAALAADYGLTIPSIATALHWQFPLTDPNPAGRDIVRRMLELAEAAGAGAVLVVPGLVTPSAAYDAVYQRALEALQELAPDAEAHGVVIGVENVWNKFLLSPLEFRDFLDAVGSPWVKAYFDCGNVLVSGYPEQWIRILGPRLVRVHVKDFKTNVGNVAGFTGLLQGDADWPAVLAALQAVGYDGFLTAEVPPPALFPSESLTLLSRSLDIILGSQAP